MSSIRKPDTFDPGHLLDFVRALGLTKDAALAGALGVGPPLISKMRSRQLTVGASILIRMHEVSGLSIQELRDLMGDRRKVYRISAATGWYGCEREALARAHQIGGAA